MRSEGKKRTLELSLIQGFSKIEKLFGGATRNRNLTISGWISLMYLLAKEVISRYCSTGGLQYFAVSCGVDFLLFHKGNALFWNISRYLVFLLHLGVGFQPIYFLFKLPSISISKDIPSTIVIVSCLAICLLHSSICRWHSKAKSYSPCVHPPVILALYTI